MHRAALFICLRWRGGVVISGGAWKMEYICEVCSAFSVCKLRSLSWLPRAGVGNGRWSSS